METYIIFLTRPIWDVYLRKHTSDKLSLSCKLSLLFKLKPWMMSWPMKSHVTLPRVMENEASYHLAVAMSNTILNNMLFYMDNIFYYGLKYFWCELVQWCLITPVKKVLKHSPSEQITSLLINLFLNRHFVNHSRDNLKNLCPRNDNKQLGIDTKTYLFCYMYILFINSMWHYA